MVSLSRTVLIYSIGENQVCVKNVFIDARVSVRNLFRSYYAKYHACCEFTRRHQDLLQMESRAHVERIQCTYLRFLTEKKRNKKPCTRENVELNLQRPRGTALWSRATCNDLLNARKAKRFTRSFAGFATYYIVTDGFLFCYANSRVATREISRVWDLSPSLSLSFHQAH